MESNNKIKPTIEWMSEKYDEMNTKLFNGKLDACDFEIFTSGKGSQGRTLGHFCLCSPGLKIKRNGGRMYKPGTWENNYEDIFINADNFYNICHPKIGLNGNYSATEDGWLNTLIHEMCHYYTYMDGWAPKQAHGWEFRNIAYTVSSRSGGLITITRLASAEKMENFELDAEIQQK